MAFGTAVSAPNSSFLAVAKKYLDVLVHSFYHSVLPNSLGQ